MKEKRMRKLFSAADGPLTSRKQDRNAKCICGSGMKAKNCCGCETQYFKPKKPLTDDQRKKAVSKQKEKDLKAEVS